MSFVRVSKEVPCPICGHDKWCTIWDAGKTVACPRVASDDSRLPGFGYIHTLKKPLDVTGLTRVMSESNDIDWKGLADYYQEHYIKERDQTVGNLFASYAPAAEMFPNNWTEQNGLRAAGDAFGVGWDGKAYTIPMWASGRCCGIQRRFPSGDKCSVAGSKRGLFVPTQSLEAKVTTLYICEGASDAIYLKAYVTEGLVIGRQNCDMCDEVSAFVAATRPDNIVILADNDEPGLTGASKLSGTGYLMGRAKIFIPRDKDVRETITKRGKLEGRWI